MTPIMLCGQGRSGTTALMKLFASSPAVFADKDYPYEKRYLTYFAKQAELLSRGEPSEPFEVANLLSFNDNLLGGFPWTYSDAYRSSGWPPQRAAWLRMLWEGFTRLAPDTHPAARYYVEKTPGWLPGIVRKAMPSETVYLFRDLRDVYVSSEHWGRTEPEYLQLSKEGRTAEMAEMIAYEFMQNYENYTADQTAGDAFLIRYEDHIADASATVSRIEQKFSLPLNLEQSLQNWSSHATSKSLSASVERWRKEGIDERAHRAFLKCVGRELQALGYEVEAAPEPVFEFRFSQECMSGARLEESGDGRLAFENGRARVEVHDPRYWLRLPLENFDAESVAHIWVCLAQGPGNVCSLAWRAPDADFSVATAFHVEHQASETWRVLDFPLDQFSAWRGKIAELRLCPFNLYQEGFSRRLSFSSECRGAGYLRWVRGFRLD